MRKKKDEHDFFGELDTDPDNGIVEKGRKKPREHARWTPYVAFVIVLLFTIVGAVLLWNILPPPQ